MLSILEEKTTEVSADSRKANSPIFVTSGSCAVVNAVLEKAYPPISVIAERSMVSSFRQCLNAPSGITLIAAPSLTLSRFSQYAKASAPSSVAEERSAVVSLGA